MSDIYLSTKILAEEKFNTMPVDTRSLFLHLCKRADEEGVVFNPREVVKESDTQIGDLELLIEKDYIKATDAGVRIANWGSKILGNKRDIERLAKKE